MLDANDVELLQKVFSKYADQDGLMTKADVKQVPAIAQLLVSSTQMHPVCCFLFMETVGRSLLLACLGFSVRIKIALELLRDNNAGKNINVYLRNWHAQEVFFSSSVMYVTESQPNSYCYYLQVDGDILEEELSEIWDKSPKFPDVDIAEERIDVDSFVQGMLFG